MKNRISLVLIVLGYFGLEVIFPKGFPAISLGSISVYLLDLVTLLCLLAIILKLFRTNFRIKKAIIPLLFLGVLLFTSLLRGIQLFGIGVAVNSMRGYLYFYIITLSVVMFYWDSFSLSKLIHMWGLISWLIFGVVIFRWMLLVSGINLNPGWMALGGGFMRVINAAQTLFLVQAVIMALFIPKEEKLIPFQRAMPWVLIPTVVLLQHRTVWVILLIVLVWFALKNKRTFIYVPLIIVASILLFLVIFVVFENTLLGTTFAGSATNMQNFEWRLEGWKQLLLPVRYQSDVDYLIGQPFGTGYSRVIFDSSNSVDVAPHNFFVQTFLNIGAIGSLLLLIIYIKPIASLIRHKNLLFYSPFLLLLVSQLIFFLTYSPNYEQGLLLGSALLISNKVIGNGGNP
jgi:hypothetical protein